MTKRVLIYDEGADILAGDEVINVITSEDEGKDVERLGTSTQDVINTLMNACMRVNDSCIKVEWWAKFVYDGKLCTYALSSDMMGFRLVTAERIDGYDLSFEVSDGDDVLPCVDMINLAGSLARTVYPGLTGIRTDRGFQ